MQGRVFVQFFALLALLASTWWIAQLNAESHAVDTLIGLVGTESKGLDQIREMSTTMGEFSQCKKEWIERGFRIIENPKTVGTNALTFGVFGIGAFGWASELSTICFQRLGYETRLLQVVDEHGRAVRIAIDVSRPNGERVIFDRLLNHLHLDAETGAPLPASELAEQWQTICSEGTQAGFCQYSFELGIPYANWCKFGPTRSIAESFFEFLGIETLKALELSSKSVIPLGVWEMKPARHELTFAGLKLR